MSDPRTMAHGVLEMHPKGYGFLRNPARNYAPTPTDAVRPRAAHRQVQPRRRRHARRPARTAAPRARPARDSPPSNSIEGGDPKAYRRRNWDELTAVDPTKWIRLETGPEPLTTRVMDMFTPIGMGQRGLIVAPPRTGKTVLLQHIAQAVITNHPNDAPHGAARGRAAGGGDRHAADVAAAGRRRRRSAAGRGDRVQFRPRHREPHPPRGAGGRAGEAAHRAGPRRVRAARQPDAAGPRVQQDRPAAAGRCPAASTPRRWRCRSGSSAAPAPSRRAAR